MNVEAREESLPRMARRIAAELQRLQAFPNLTLLDVSPTDLSRMHEHMLRYSLRPRDALHLTAMEKCSCLDLVSQDADFDHIPSLRRITL